MNEQYKISDEQLVDYILCVLTVQEHAELASRIADDASLQERVAQWEAVLGQMHETVSPVTPPDRVWDVIANRLAFHSIAADTVQAKAEETVKVEQAEQAEKLTKTRRRKPSFGFYLIPAFATLMVAFMLSFYMHLQPDYRAKIVSADNTGVYWEITANEDSVAFVSMTDVSAENMDCVAWIERKDGERIKLGAIPDTGNHAKKRVALPASVTVTEGDKVMIYMVNRQTRAVLPNKAPKTAVLQRI